MPVSCDDRNLITDWGANLSWNDIIALHISKVDAIQCAVTILDFECVNGEFIEINVDEPGFNDLRRKLADYLPLPIDWCEQMESMRPGETLTLFDRRARTTS